MRIEPTVETMKDRLSILCFDNVRGIELCLKNMKNPMSIFSQVAIYCPVGTPHSFRKSDCDAIKYCFYSTGCLMDTLRRRRPMLRTDGPRER